MRQNVLLTGATGAIGAALLPELLALGCKVYCLVRPKDGQSPAARLAGISGHPRAIAIAGDMAQPLCGVDPAGLKIGKFIHCAADTSLADAKASAVMGANRDGTLNALALCRAFGHCEFHYVGTTYIAGDAASLAEQAPGEAVIVGRPRNSYEASKYEAECQVRNSGLVYSILRPAIVVGRSDDGSAPQLEGFYSCLKGISKIRDAMWSGRYRDEHDKPYSQKSKFVVPIGVKGMDVASLNLIQLDWVARTLAHLVALTARGRTYNLAHHEPVPLKRLMGTMFEALGLVNVSVVEPEALATHSLVIMALNRFINREIDQFRPYLRASTCFHSNNIYADLGPGWPRPPAITSEFLLTSIRRVQAGWHRDVQRSAAPGPAPSQRQRSAAPSEVASPVPA